LRLFLRETPKYAATLAKHEQDGNRRLYKIVDRVLDRFARASTKPRVPKPVRSSAARS